MSDAGYSVLAFGGWPAKAAPVYSANPNPQVMYVDPLAGSDINNPSATQARPLKTLAEVSKRIVGFPNAVDIHLKNADYPLPDGGVFLESRMLNGRIRIVADEVWDPTVFTVQLSGPAAPASDVTSIVLAGIGPQPSYRGLTLEVTSGGVVQRRTIRNNGTVGEGPADQFFIPAYAFDAVVPGDAVRVLVHNARMRPPATANADTYIFAADCPTYEQIDTDAIGNNSSERKPGLLLQGVSLPAGAGSQALYFGRVQLWMYGVQQPDPYALYLRDTEWMTGAGLFSEQPEHEGWGFGVLDTGAHFFMQGASGSGYICAVGDFGVMSRSEMALYGGAFVRLLGGLQGSKLNTLGPFPQNIPTLFDARGGGSVAVKFDGPDANAVLKAAEVHGGGAGIQVDNGATVTIDAAVTGGTDAGDAVSVGYGRGRVLLTGGVPQFGGAGTDYVVAGAAAPQNKAFFAAVGDSILGLKDASVIVRVS